MQELQHIQTNPACQDWYIHPQPCPWVLRLWQHPLTWHPAAHSRMFNCSHHLEGSLSCTAHLPLLEMAPKTLWAESSTSTGAHSKTWVKGEGSKDRVLLTAWEIRHILMSQFGYCFCWMSLLAASQQGALSFQLSDVTFQSIFFRNICFIHNMALHSF